MKSTLLILLILFFPIIGFSQVQTYDFGRNYTDSLPQEFKLDISQIRNRIYGTIPEDFKQKESHLRSSLMFSDQSAFATTSRMTSGIIYSDWKVFEDYLNEVFDKVIPDDFPDKKLVHIYLQKGGDFNAFMTPSGISYVNIGVFAEINDEASLAGILAHEFAHYYLSHSVKEFIKAEKGDFRGGVFGKNQSALKFSVKSETEADSLAMIWMEQSGYAVSAMATNFKNSKERETKLISLYKDVWEIKETTHPLADSRLEAVENFQGKKDGKFFLVSEAKFRNLKEKAKPEILKHLLEGFEYSNCLEMGYKFHLKDTNNPTYLYYMMEAIRRSGFRNPEFWRKNFITNRYFEIFTNNLDRKEKRKVEKHLFESDPNDFLLLTKEEIQQMEGEFYWQDEVKFRTNEQAFDFFFRVSQLFDEPECVLSNALSITKDIDFKNKQLEKYLSYKNIRFREFAEALLAKNISKSLENKKMIVWVNLATIVRQGDDDILIRKEDWDAPSSLSAIFDTIMMEFPEVKGVYLPDLIDTRLNDYTILNDLFSFSWDETISRGNRAELHILDPRYWEAFRKLGVNEIEFMFCIYYESRKAEKTQEAYKEMIEKDHLDIFNEKKRTKYLEVYITAIRSIENKAMKIKYYGGEIKLNFKKQARPQIITLLQKRIKRMQVKKKEIDRIYRKN